jgi:predicted O-methyltransferase YrrM
MMKFVRIFIIPVLFFYFALSAFSQNDPFDGITDETVLPMLKRLPYNHGGMNVPAADGRLLYDIIVDNNYQRGLEIGTSNGYSGLWLGLAFQQTGGKVITIEIEEKRAKEARENFRKAGLDDVIDSRINDAFKEIPKLEGDFDFIFLDAWKPDYIKFYEMLYPRLKAGGTLTAHNVRSQGSQMRDFLEAIQNNPDLETVINKDSRAGVSISVKKR